MKYLDLIDTCKKAIEDGRCLGCTALENPLFRGNANCEYIESKTAKESIEKIHRILGIQETVWK